MRLEELEALAGTETKVIYRPHPGAEPEEGVVVRTNASGAFVRYGSSLTPKHTRPDQLEPAAEWTEEQVARAKKMLADHQERCNMLLNDAVSALGVELGLEAQQVDDLLDYAAPAWLESSWRS